MLAYKLKDCKSALLKVVADLCTQRVYGFVTDSKSFCEGEERDPVMDPAMYPSMYPAMDPA
jgi:hypothetical protein